MNVDFLIAGTQRGGTTALLSYLRDHAEICMATPDEVHFFDDEEYFRSSTPDYSRYHNAFHPGDGKKVLGEKTPIYMYWYPAPKRVWDYNPAMKWILLLRNPIERAYSHWSLERRRNAEQEDFRTAIHDERTRCREALPLQHRVYSYTDRGFYTEQLRRIWSFFPRAQTLVLKSEELRAQPLPTLNRICEFLGIGPYAHIDPVDLNSSRYPPRLVRRVFPSRRFRRRMKESERSFLKELFRAEITELEELLDWDCSEWYGSRVR